MWLISVDKKIFKIIINLIGKMSSHQISELIGEKDDKILSDWYYNNRHLAE
jgi:hypothetical protein